MQDAIRNLIAEGFPVQQVLLELQAAVLAEVSIHLVDSPMHAFVDPSDHLSGCSAACTIILSFPPMRSNS